MAVRIESTVDAVKRLRFVKLGTGIPTRMRVVSRYPAVVGLGERGALYLLGGWYGRAHTTVRLGKEKSLCNGLLGCCVLLGVLDPADYEAHDKAVAAWEFEDERVRRARTTVFGLRGIGFKPSAELLKVAEMK